MLDTVALTADKPERGLVAEHVGTVVEVLAEGVFEVELTDDERRTYASMAVPAARLIIFPGASGLTECSQGEPIRKTSGAVAPFAERDAS